MKALALALLLAACATVGPAEYARLRIEHNHWGHTTVRLYCGPALLRTYRQVAENRSVPLPACQHGVTAVVEADGDRWATESVLLRAGDELVLRVENYLPYTTLVPRSQGGW